MTPERWKRVEELYHAARTKPSGERAAFLLDACRDDESLRRDVESLLKEQVSADGFLDSPARADRHAEIGTDLHSSGRDHAAGRPVPGGLERGNRAQPRRG